MLVGKGVAVCRGRQGELNGLLVSVGERRECGKCHSGVKASKTFVPTHDGLIS